MSAQLCDAEGLAGEFQFDPPAFSPQKSMLKIFSSDQILFQSVFNK